MGVDWDDAEFEKQLRRHAAERLARVALLVVAAHQKNLSVANPTPHDAPAPRGQFPRGRTFNLRANVGYAPTSLDALARTGRVQVGIFAPAFYGLSLKNRGWLGLADTVERQRQAIDSLLGRSA